MIAQLSINDCIFAMTSSIAGILSFKQLSLSKGLWLDKPGGRKQHFNPTPAIGGLGIMIPFLLLCFLQGVSHYKLQLACVAFLILGALDDHLDVTALKKLLIQVLVVSVLCLSRINNTSLFVIAGVAMFVIFYINAVNFTDGADGLMGLSQLGILVNVVYWGLLTGNTAAIQFASLYGICLACFLMFNLRSPWLKKALVFMGDAGSIPAGMISGWLTLELAGYLDHSYTIHSTMVLGCVLAYPCLDAARVIISRMMKGHSPFCAGRDHLHHIMREYGIKDSSITLLLFMLNTVIGFTAVTLWS